MSAWAYYNEHDPGAAAWLRELIGHGLIAPGVVDERSIRDVRGDDLKPFVQCHFFAGIGVWSHALRRAGWADERPVWTGSCPCQPFSAAGKGGGFDDPRHLWPEFFRLIFERRPDRVFGEQVASAGEWIDLVRLDLEAIGYAFAAVDLSAAGFRGAHIRQRFDWVADAHLAERWADLAPRHDGDWPAPGRVEGDGQPGTGGYAGGVALANGRDASPERKQRSWEQRLVTTDGGPVRLEHPAGDGREQWRAEPGRRRPGGGCGQSGVGFPASIGWPRRGSQPEHSVARPAGQDIDWIGCSDGRWRPVEAGTFPLAATSPGRVGLLRGYGNALDAEQTVEFIGACMEAFEIAALPMRVAA